jgi:recombination protein RecR
MKHKLKHFYKLVDALESLPSVGKKSALKIAYHLSIENKYSATRLIHDIENASTNIRLCKFCNCLSENEICEICIDDSRDKSKLCIVESPKDIFLIEESKCFDGLYFSLGELLSEQIEQLIHITQEVNEIIFALTSSIQNESLILYIEDKLKDKNISFSKIATGIPNGVRLENVDSISLSSAIISRVSI